MRYALVGYGRMGREVEIQAGRRGHELVRVIDPEVRGERVRPEPDAEAMEGAEVAFEFTRPDQAEANVLALLRAGCPVVCGTTGWEPGPALQRATEQASVGAVIAPNFSVGMNLFYEIVRDASRRLGASGLYDPFVLESHHRGKLDAPSGTARKLATMVAESDPRHGEVHVGNPTGALPPDAVHVVSVRAGHEPGTHTVGFDGEFDVIRLGHSARGRAGFAMGAVLAAEWLPGKTGLHGFGSVLQDLLAKRSGDAGPAKIRRPK